MSTERPPEVAKFFNQARRIPMLIGKLPDGSRIWGGPYTGYQLIALFVAGGVLYLFHDLWSSGSILSDIFLGVVIAACVGLLAGRIPLDARNPMVLVAGFGNALQAPRTGTYRGMAPRLRKPHRSASGVSAQLSSHGVTDVAVLQRAEEELAESEAEPLEQEAAPDRQVEPATPEPQSVSKLPRTGLERLIAQSQKES